MLIGSRSAKPIPCIKAGTVLVVEKSQRAFVHFPDSVIVGLDQKTTLFVYRSTDACYGFLWKVDLDPQRSVNAVAPPVFNDLGRTIQVVVRCAQLVKNDPQNCAEIVLVASCEAYRRRYVRKLHLALVDVQPDSENGKGDPGALGLGVYENSAKLEVPKDKVVGPLQFHI